METFSPVPNASWYASRAAKEDYQSGKARSSTREIFTSTKENKMTFRRFKLVRTTDITGISGTGEIAVGVQWPDQSATLFWLKTETNGYYKSLDQLQQIHCYNDASGQPNARVEWID